LEWSHHSRFYWGCGFEHETGENLKSSFKVLLGLWLWTWNWGKFKDAKYILQLTL